MGYSLNFIFTNQRLKSKLSHIKDLLFCKKPKKRKQNATMVIFSLFITYLFLILACQASTNDVVVKLTDANFEDTTQASTGQTTGKWFVNFHSPNCGHCQNLTPIWTSLAEELKMDHSDSGVLIGSVDVQENPILAERFEIKGLPTLLYFAEESMFVYPPARARSVDEFITFVLGGDRENSGSAGGYQNAEKSSVPKGPGGLLKLVGDLRKNVYDIEILRFLLDDVEHIFLLRKNAALLLIGIGFVLGFFVAALLGLNRRSDVVMMNKKDKKD